MVIGRGAGRKAAVDLLDTVGHALDRLSVGDVLLDNFKTGLFIVNESDLGGFAGAQRTVCSVLVTMYGSGTDSSRTT